MALRRLHWQNSLLAELLYLVNVYKVRVGAGRAGPSLRKEAWACPCRCLFQGRPWPVASGLGGLVLPPLVWFHTAAPPSLPIVMPQTGRVHWLPPVKQPAERPTFFWLF